MLQIKPWGFVENAGEFQSLLCSVVRDNSCALAGIEFKRASQQMRVETQDLLLPFSTWQCPGDH
jgi:hypothetical protein